MTENKRFKIYSDFDDWSIIDTTGEYVAEDYLDWMSEKQVCNLLNEQEEQLKPFTNLAKDYHLTLNQLFDVCSECIGKLDSIYEQKELLSLQEIHIKRLKERVKELETRNQRQYERLKELTDLMFKRDWKTLNDMVDEWEKEEEQLQKYGG